MHRYNCVYADNIIVWANMFSYRILGRLGLPLVSNAAFRISGCVSFHLLLHNDYIIKHRVDYVGIYQTTAIESCMSIEECYILVSNYATSAVVVVVPGCRVSIKARRPSQATLCVL